MKEKIKIKGPFSARLQLQSRSARSHVNQSTDNVQYQMYIMSNPCFARVVCLVVVTVPIVVMYILLPLLHPSLPTPQPLKLPLLSCVVGTQLIMSQARCTGQVYYATRERPARASLLLAYAEFDIE